MTQNEHNEAHASGNIYLPSSPDENQRETSSPTKNLVDVLKEMVEQSHFVHFVHGVVRGVFDGEARIDSR